MNNTEIERLKSISKHIRQNVVHMAYNASSSHVGTALSMIDILVVLYFKTLRIDTKNPYAIHRDKFILSKGHGASGLYATLAERGFFDKAVLNTYEKDESLLFGHPKKHSVPGIEASTGSLGHGLSIGCGLALADKNSKNDSKTIVLMGDGECNEGSVWEAALFAVKQNLNNLILIIDNNKWQALGRVSEVTSIEPIADKWKAFKWKVIETDGHNFSEIDEAVKKAYTSIDAPTAIICHTIKGKGVSFMEDRLEWHYKSPNEKQLEEALKELR